MTAQEMAELARALREWRATLGDGGECGPIPPAVLAAMAAGIHTFGGNQA